MSAFSSIALPGGIPTSGGGRNSITPEALFTSNADIDAYRRIAERARMSGAVRVKGVHVKVFDLSDGSQVSEYEKLWAMLLEKASIGDVVIDHHNDLVRRPDGTSYWMKYVEYVEFAGDDEVEKAREDSKGDGK